jgi:signal recognition particle receptor subunit beta
VVLGDIYHELESEDKVIIIIGPTGTGKSYFVRAMTSDESVLISATLQSGQSQSQTYASKN